MVKAVAARVDGAEEVVFPPLVLLILAIVVAAGRF